jgi:hypothetical protein
MYKVVYRDNYIVGNDTITMVTILIPHGIQMTGDFVHGGANTLHLI